MNKMSIGIVAALLIVVATVAYRIGGQQAAPEITAVSSVQTTNVAAATRAITEKQPTTATTTSHAAGSVMSPGAQFTHFRVGDRNVKRILPDGELMWVATSGGVIRYDTRTDQYKLFDIKSGLLANGIFHLSKLDERLLVGTYGGGMSIMKKEGEGWDTYNVPEGLADAFVYDVLKTRKGDIWIATWSGANLVRGGDLDNPEKWEVYTVKNTQGGLPNDWVYALAQGPDDTVWMATEGGLTRYKDGEWQNWQHEDGLGAPYELVKDQITFKNDPAKMSKHHARQKTEMGLEDVNVAYNPNYIISLAVDKDGVVWAGTWGGGLARYDGKDWRHYTMADGLSGNHIFMLYIDPQERLWIGTNNGLVRKDGDQFKAFSTRHGLFSNNVFSMATATDGSLWVGSYGGVAQISALD